MGWMGTGTVRRGPSSRARGQKRGTNDAAGDDEIFGRVVSIRNLIFFSNFEPIDPAVCWKFPLLPVPPPLRPPRQPSLRPTLQPRPPPRARIPIHGINRYRPARFPACPPPPCSLSLSLSLSDSLAFSISLPSHSVRPHTFHVKRN